MFEGIIRIRKIEVETNEVVYDKIVYNSITAQGLQNLMAGRLFGDNSTPLIHVYSHPDNVTPAVLTVSGYIATCTQTVAPAVSFDATQMFYAYTMQGELPAPGVARTIVTIGLGAPTQTTTPTFAVRLTNPITQGPSQLIEITYKLVARKSNNVSSDVSGAAPKVTNNSWDKYFRDTFGPAASPVVISAVTLVDTPDDFSTGSTITGPNALVENLGTTNANQRQLTDVGVTATPTVTQFLDETTTVVHLTVPNDQGVGYNFNKTLISTTTGVQMYVNDMGYSVDIPIVTSQNLFPHPVGGAKPYPSLDETLATSVGDIQYIIPPSATMHVPVFIKMQYMTDGAIGAATYFFSTRFSWGFKNNDYGQEMDYRLPSYSLRDGAGAWLKTVSTTIAYNGLTPARFNDDMIEAFSVIMSPDAGSTYIGEHLQYDGVCLPSATQLTFVTHLGTTITKLPMTCTAINNYALVRVGVQSRLFVSCSTTGLWRINEVSATGQPYVPGAPFQVAVANVDTTKCYAVASHNVTGDNTIFAVFEGGLVRSTNGGTSWSVYNASTAAGTLPFTHAGLTDANWNTVKAIIVGPTDLSTGVSVIALVGTSSVQWIELTNTGATAVGAPVTLTGIDTGPFKTQKFCSYFPQVGTDVPSSQMWVFYDGTTLTRVPYTAGAGPGTPVAASADLSTKTVKVRFFEPTSIANPAPAMVLYSVSATSLVLVDSTFTVVMTAGNNMASASDNTKRLMNASCRPLRHFYMSSVPQFVYFNPFYNAGPHGGAAHHIVCRDYEYVGDEWIRVTDSRMPAVHGSYTITGKPTHLSADTIFSVSPTGILSDLPTGITMAMLQNQAGDQSAVNGDYFTSTLTSGIQKDNYTSFDHKAAHAYYRSQLVQAATPTAATAPDFVNRPLNFITAGVETKWFSQQGVLSSYSNAVATLTRSEVVTPDNTNPDFSVSFRVTAPASTGTVAVGISSSALQPTLGALTLDQALPVQIRFSGTQYQVYRDGVTATSLFTINQGDLFTITTTGTNFVVSVNNTPLALTTASTLPSALVGDTLAIGAYALSNQNRYAYDMRINSWPVSGNGLTYYKVVSGGLDVGVDSALVTVESRISSPMSSSFTGLNVTTSYSAIGLTIPSTDQIVLLPKTALLLVNTVPEIAAATMNLLLYKK